MSKKPLNTTENGNDSNRVLSVGRSCSNCKNYRPHNPYRLWCQTSGYSVTPIYLSNDEIMIKTDCNEKRWLPC